MLVHAQLQVPECPVQDDVVKATENWLTLLVCYKAPPSPPPPYPLCISQHQQPLPLERYMHAELEESWLRHQTQMQADSIHMSQAQFEEEVAQTLVSHARPDSCWLHY